TSASVSAPRRVRRSRMPPSLSESESNISFHGPDSVPNTKSARGRIALSGGGLRPPGPVGGRRFGSLARAGGTYGCDARESRTLTRRQTHAAAHEKEFLLRSACEVDSGSLGSLNPKSHL